MSGLVQWDVSPGASGPYVYLCKTEFRHSKVDFPEQPNNLILIQIGFRRSLSMLLDAERLHLLQRNFSKIKSWFANFSKSVLNELTLLTL